MCCHVCYVHTCLLSRIHNQSDNNLFTEVSLKFYVVGSVLFSGVIIPNSFKAFKTYKSLKIDDILPLSLLKAFSFNLIYSIIDSIFMEFDKIKMVF